MKNNPTRSSSVRLLVILVAVVGLTLCVLVPQLRAKSLLRQPEKIEIFGLQVYTEDGQTIHIEEAPAGLAERLSSLTLHPSGRAQYQAPYHMEKVRCMMLVRYCGKFYGLFLGELNFLAPQKQHGYIAYVIENEAAAELMDFLSQ